MNWFEWSLVGMAALTAALIFGYEVYAFYNRVGGDTVSEIIWRLTGQYPLLVFLAGLVIGLVAGHLFWTERCPPG